MNTKSTFQEARDNEQLLQKIKNGETIKLDPNRSIEAQVNNIIDNLKNNPNFDTQVKVKKNKAPKRKFSNAYKLQILNTLDACKDSHERAALLRKEGLYYARVSTWKKQFQDRKFISNKTPKSMLLTQQLTREVASLKKKLLQAEAIIELQKKISELLSINILDHDTREM
jgi:transposase